MLDFFVFSCIFLLVESQDGKIFPPQNLSLQWDTDFKPNLTWDPPQHPVKNCTYKYHLFVNNKTYTETETSWSVHTVMQGGVLNVEIQSLCNDRKSELVSISANYQKLVENVSCYIRSLEHAHCSWVPVTPAPDLRFFYRLGEEPRQEKLLECSSYSSTSNVRTGCSLKASVTNRVFMVFNATLNQRSTRNTFGIYLGDKVKPDPLNWTVSESNDEFNISWIPPDLFELSQWNFQINYTECGEEREVKSTKGKPWMTLPRVSHCQYQMKIRADSEYGSTPWSYIKSFKAVTDPSAWMYAVIIIPLMFAILAALSLMCCRKNKEKLFPKVPQPKDFISDISDNNNKSPSCDLFVPEDEENCKIMLVMDPQIDKLDS